MLLDLTEFESQIEEDMAIGLQKHLPDPLSIRPQVKVNTGFMTFHIDLVVINRYGARIGIECDGKEFHQDAVRDKCRDALILGTRAVEAIYRFRWHQIYFHRDDCYYFITRRDPSVFTEAGRSYMDLIASAEIKQVLKDEAMEERAKSIPDWTPWVFYKKGDKQIRSVLDRRSLKSGRSVYDKILAVANCNRALSFDELVELIRNRWRH